jgi:hypothetical protein
VDATDDEKFYRHRSHIPSHDASGGHNTSIQNPRDLSEARKRCGTGSLAAIRAGPDILGPLSENLYGGSIRTFEYIWRPYTNV